MKISFGMMSDVCKEIFSIQGANHWCFDFPPRVEFFLRGRERTTSGLIQPVIEIEGEDKS